MSVIVRFDGKKYQLHGLWLGVLWVLLLAVWLMTSSAVFADTPEPQGPTDDEVNALARQLYCPVCENIPLDVCPTQACAQWRDLVRQKLAAGWSEQQIKDYFVAQYGDRVLDEPPLRGLNWLVYILPLVFFLLGVFILVRVLRGMRHPLEAAAADDLPPDVDDVYLARMEEELQRRKNE